MESTKVPRRGQAGFTVVELNDGGSSRLPDQLDPWELYQAMLEDPP